MSFRQTISKQHVKTILLLWLIKSMKKV